MKKFTYLFFYSLCSVLINCTNEYSPEQISQDYKDPNFRVISSKVGYKGNVLSSIGLRSSLDEPCMTTNLIAGQHHIAGSVNVDSDGEDLFITYLTNDDWSIDVTHLSIGNCNEQWVPTTGSGNPKIGKFEHSESHVSGTNEVTYIVSLDALDEFYCFAAHAEVNGPDGNETAWAEGINFEGNSWAMYVEGLISDCYVDDTPDPYVPPVR